jgi:hypothetical protein
MHVSSLSADILADIIDYAITTKRLPMYVYEPDLSNRLVMQMMRTWSFTKDQVANLDKGEPITDQTQLVYCGRVPKTPVSKIPLMLTTSGMMYGGDRAIWLQNAEKIIYFSTTIYDDKTRNSRTIHELT